VTDVLRRIRREDGLTVLAGPRHLGAARRCRDRIVAPLAGRPMFDGTPAG
jgi:ABC-type phosphate/phosphonate transport system ATPase subunit